jgi:hypothetical protein
MHGSPQTLRAKTPRLREGHSPCALLRERVMGQLRFPPARRGHNRRVDLGAFVQDGYVAVRGVVDAATVAACREQI